MKILDSLVEMVRLMHGLAGKVARHDRDLAQQLKRASTSVGLNASEGLYAKAGKRRSRLEDAVNSARETLMALRLAGVRLLAGSGDGCCGEGGGFGDSGAVDARLSPVSERGLEAGERNYVPSEEGGGREARHPVAGSGMVSNNGFAREAALAVAHDSSLNAGTGIDLPR